MPLFAYLGTDDYEQLGDGYRQLISIFEVGADGVTLTPRGECEGVCVGANFLAECGGHLYATDGMGSAIVALAVGADGSLTEINRQSCAELHNFPCHLDFSACGRWVLTAAYGDGTVAVWPRDPVTGALGPCTDSKKQHLNNPNPDLADRQEQAHAHQIIVHEKWALCCDLGTDTVYVYELDPERGALSGASNAPRHLRLAEGSGPRHLEFHPNGKWVYITAELSGHVVTAQFDNHTGELKQTHSINALPEGIECSRKGHRGNADLHCSSDGTRVPGCAAVFPQPLTMHTISQLDGVLLCLARFVRAGRFVYTTTRTDHAIVAFTVDSTGGLSFLARYPTLGKCPRNFHLDGKDGDFLVAALFDSGVCLGLLSTHRVVVQWCIVDRGKWSGPHLKPGPAGLCERFRWGRAGVLSCKLRVVEGRRDALFTRCAPSRLHWFGAHY